MLEKLKKIAFLSGQGVFIAALVILMVCPFSCKLTAEGIDIIKGDYSAPKMFDCHVIDDKHLELNFSENVAISSISICKKEDCTKFDSAAKNNFDVVNVDFPIINDENLNFSIMENNNNGRVVIGLDNSTEIGSSYIVSGVVEDRSGNSLTFSVPFSGYNGNIPKMIFTEVHPEYSKVGSKGNYYRCEYVELLALEDGNLYGLVVGSATNGAELDYHFPAIEVKKGEVIVVHLRVKGDGCISEDGDNINLASSEYCSPNVRDLWLNNSSSALSDSYDAVYLKDSINNKYCDGMMYINKKTKAKWSDEVADKINEMVSGGIFASGNIDMACDEQAVTPTLAFLRTNVAEIILEADACLERGEEIVVPMFNSNHWIVGDADAGKI